MPLLSSGRSAARVACTSTITPFSSTSYCSNSLFSGGGVKDQVVRFEKRFKSGVLRSCHLPKATQGLGSFDQQGAYDTRSIGVLMG